MKRRGWDRRKNEPLRADKELNGMEANGFDLKWKGND